MRMFLAGFVVAILIAAASGYALNQAAVGSAAFNSTGNVRL